MGQANHVLDKALLASGLEWWKSHDGDPDSPLWPGWDGLKNCLLSLSRGFPWLGLQDLFFKIR